MKPTTSSTTNGPRSKHGDKLANVVAATTPGGAATRANASSADPTLTVVHVASNTEASITQLKRLAERRFSVASLRLTECLGPGDPCEFRYPARSDWKPATVVRNGGYAHWTVVRCGATIRGLYIEHVRAPGTDPWGNR